MAALIADPELEAEVIADRRGRGIDLIDEVWDEVYVMVPGPDNEHQSLAGRLYAILGSAVESAGQGLVLLSVNVSGQRKRWRETCRVPDVDVLLNDTAAVNCETHWYVGPDFGVEITRSGERTHEKLDFFFKVKSREMLIVQRRPRWRPEPCRLKGRALVEVGRSTPANDKILKSAVLPLTWQLLPGETRPQIRIARADGSEERMV